MSQSALSFDVIILGAGMAGASLAAELSSHRRVALVEVEDQPGRHATGRSAAMFFECYGNAPIRALTRASRAFLTQAPGEFCDTPLMSRRAGLFIAPTERADALMAMFEGDAVPSCLHRLSAEQVHAIVPILRPEWRSAGGALDDSGHDIDVAGLHQSYLRATKRAGCQFFYGAGAVSLQRDAGGWELHSRLGLLRAPIVVNASGAWADEVAQQAGVAPVGLQPMRRSALTMPAPEGCDIRDWPLVIDVDESFYFKPDAGQLMLSPANEDPMPPCDVMPEELDLAIAVDRFETATTVTVRKVSHRWAGLRSFVADRTPVVGFDGAAEGFFWLAGQGGYGIQTAPAMARTAAGLLLGKGVPDDIAAEGVSAADLSPARAALHSGQPPAKAH